MNRHTTNQANQGQTTQQKPSDTTTLILTDEQYDNLNHAKKVIGLFRFLFAISPPKTGIHLNCEELYHLFVVLDDLLPDSD